MSTSWHPPPRHLPDSIPALKTVRGIGKRLAQRYGEELVRIVTDYRREHGIEHVMLPESSVDSPTTKQTEKPKANMDTKKISFELFEKGLSIPRIAAERGLTISTIEGYLAYCVSTDALAIGRIASDDKRRTIEQALTKLPGKPLKELKTVLGNACSYGDIRLVLAHIRK